MLVKESVKLLRRFLGKTSRSKEMNEELIIFNSAPCIWKEGRNSLGGGGGGGLLEEFLGGDVPLGPWIP